VARLPQDRRSARRHGIVVDPLFAGSGTAIAALNLYGRVPDSLAALTAAVWLAYGPAGEPGPDPLGHRLRRGRPDTAAAVIAEQQ
jgi:hypothetical protein